MMTRLGACLLAFTSMASAHADCGLSLQVSNISIVWNQNFSFQAVNLVVRKSKKQECDYSVTFGKGSASNYERRMRNGTNELRYQLYKDSSLTQILKEVPDLTSSSDYISGSFPEEASQAQTVTYYVQIPYDPAGDRRTQPSGVYTDNFTVKLYEDKNHNTFHKPEDVANVQISATIPKLLEISLVDSGAGFDASATSRTENFGNLAQGQSRSFDLLVRSNAGYKITFSSRNSSSLVRSGDPKRDRQRIPYIASVGGTRYTIGRRTQVASGSGQTGAGGAQHPVTFIITGDPSQAFAGSYADTITVTAINTE